MFACGYAVLARDQTHFLHSTSCCLLWNDGISHGCAMFFQLRHVFADAPCLYWCAIIFCVFGLRQKFWEQDSLGISRTSWDIQVFVIPKSFVGLAPSLSTSFKLLKGPKGVLFAAHMVHSRMLASCITPPSLAFLVSHHLKHFYPAMLVKTTWLILVGFCIGIPTKKRGGVFSWYMRQNNPNSQGFVVVGPQAAILQDECNFVEPIVYDITDMLPSFINVSRVRKIIYIPKCKKGDSEDDTGFDW